MKKKILIMHLGRNGAGPAYTFEMSKALKNKGLEVECIVSKGADNIQNYEKENIKLHKYSTYFNLITFLLKIFDIKSFYRLIKYINKSGAKYIYIPMDSILHIFIYPFIKKNIKKIYTIHDIERHLGEENIILSLSNRIMQKSSDSLIVLTKKYVDVIEKRTQKKTYHIAHPSFNIFSETGNILYDNNNILFFGRISKYKGLDVLLEVFEEVLKKHPKQKLLIVGNGDISPYIMQINKLKENIILVNKWIQEDEIQKYFDISDFIVIPYKEASQSGVIPLAYSFSKTVISTSIGGLEEQVIDGTTGLLVKANDNKDLENKILKFLDNRELIREYGNNAKKYSEKNLTWEYSATKFLEILKELK